VLNPLAEGAGTRRLARSWAAGERLVLVAPISQADMRT